MKSVRFARTAPLLALVALLAGVSVDAGRPLFTTAFPPEEFAAHRERLFDRIGDAMAVVQGAAELPSYLPFRQNNHFFYLTGVEVPRALVILDGRTRRTMLFLPARDERMEQSEGPVLVPGGEAVRLTGIADVRPRDTFDEVIERAVGAGRVVFTPFRAESLAAETPDATERHARAQAADPWDLQGSRERAFVERLRSVVPAAGIKDLDPILDALRVIKTPREVAAIRASTKLAGLAMIEAMRSAHPGMHENEIEAIGDYVFKSHGAQGIAYFGLVAAGVNAMYPHYHGGTDSLQGGDLVLFDYAPDLDYYSSDVTRMFPANGRFSPVQRELYGTYLKLYTALMQSVKPGVAPRDARRVAVERMDAIVRTTSFSAPRYRAAAEQFVDALRLGTRNSLGHFVGLEVHDVSVDIDALEPGMVFTIEPALRVPEDRIYIRLEDVLVVTGQGYENLSAFVPSNIDGIERVMAERGMFEGASASPSTQ